jgi:hypothetical protein
MTITDLREIAADSGLSHAEYCLDQFTSQVGRDATEELWEELAHLLWDHAHAGRGL